MHYDNQKNEIRQSDFNNLQETSFSQRNLVRRNLLSDSNKFSVNIIGGNYDDFIIQIFLDDMGNSYTTIRTLSNSNGTNSEAGFIKQSKNGTIIEALIFRDTNNNPETLIRSIHIDFNGRINLFGHTKLNSKKYAYYVNLNNDFTKNKSKIIDFNPRTEYDSIRSALMTSEKNMFLCGTRFEGPPWGVLLQLDSMGIPIQTKYLDFDHFFKVMEIGNSSLLVLGPKHIGRLTKDLKNYIWIKRIDPVWLGDIILKEDNIIFYVGSRKHKYFVI